MFNFSCKTVVYNRLTEMSALPLNRYANVTPAALYEHEVMHDEIIFPAEFRLLGITNVLPLRLHFYFMADK